jgi:hypothetical protein
LTPTDPHPFLARSLLGPTSSWSLKKPAPPVNLEQLAEIDPLRYVHEVCDLIDENTEEERTHGRSDVPRAGTDR